MFRRAVRILLVLLGLVALAGLAASLSGRQPRIDTVAVGEQRDGITLESRMIATNGVRLHVVLAGPPDGPPVLLLHGYPEFWWAWHEQMARLAGAGFRVIAPNQRGYEDSDKPAGIESYRVDLLLGDAIGLIDALGYESVFLAGHDWGGGLAWYLVLEHPERFRKLVMFNAPHPLAWVDAKKDEPKEETISWYRTFFQLPAIPELVGRAGNWFLLSKNLRDTSRPGTFPESDLELYRSVWDRDGAMGSMINWYRASFRFPHQVTGDGLVHTPTRLVFGMKDRFFESRLARLSIAHCASGQLVELPDASHWLLHEEPELTSRQMIEFFR